MVTRFARYAWFVLAYNIFVILWGAFVRATGSGAGCGAHWPLCNGEVIHRPQQVATLIELTHRLTSGVALLLVIGLLVWAFRAFPKGDIVRRGAVASFVLIIVEALLGAGLVLFELVAHNASVTRAFSMAIHLVNTFLLLGALTLTAWWASGGQPLRFGGRRPLLWTFVAGLAGTALIGATGAIVALGDTLFPAQSLAAGLAQDLDSTAHFLIRLRLVHPVIAILVGVGLIGLAMYCQSQSPSASVNRFATAVKTLVVVQWTAGVANVALLAPVWMQLVHLLLADMLWIAVVLLGAAVFAATQTSQARAEAPLSEQSPAPAR